VRTQPGSLGGTYDPGTPVTVAAMSAQGSSADVIIALESGAAIKAFGEGGLSGSGVADELGVVLSFP